MQPSSNSTNSQKPKVVFSTSNNLNQIPIQTTQISVQQPPQINTSQYQFQQNYYQVPQQQQISYNNNYASQVNQIPQISQQQYIIPSPNMYGNMYNFNQEYYGFQPAHSIKLLNKKEQDKDKKVVAVIVTFCNCSSYDNLFTSVQQKSQEGTKVLVYSCSSDSFDLIFKEFKGEDSKNQAAKQLIKHVKQLDPDCVVFNWECSSGYSGQSFPEGKQNLFNFIKYVIDRGHMTMFSDFSLKALINQWDSHRLGPNPFKKVGQTSSPIQLYFDKNKLIQCPSAQLQIVGQMAEGGKCHVETMGGTIVYSADKTIKKNDFYSLQILTVAQSDCETPEQKYSLEVNDKKGTAGHVLLTYKSGGHLLTSMGHWIQLMKIDTSQHKLFEIAEKQYGAQYAAQMRSQYAQMDVNSQKAYISSNAVNFVQNQAPCQNMMSKQSKYI